MSRRTFRSTVLNYYKRHGRTFPWRRTRNPYRILVSEIMLQQTQVDRVVPKYEAFIKQFPTVRALARAPLSAVLIEWQGLGYNRRAKLLHEAARAIVREYGGRVPKTLDALESLPGVGPYTAGAVMVFAYGKPVPIIETNIRTVYLHHFFKDTKDVADKEVFRLIETDVDNQKDVWRWYAALMDYGAHLKKTVGNQNTRSSHYVRQSAFEGSDRQIRGAILRALTEKPYTRENLSTDIRGGMRRIQKQLIALEREGLIEHCRGTWRLSSRVSGYPQAWRRK